MDGMDKLVTWETETTGQWVRFLLCIVLGSVLIYSALEHLLNPYQFVNSVANYSMVPESWSYWIAFVLPNVQIMAGCLLFTRTFRLEALAISTILFAVFAAAQTSAFLRGLDIECGCFGGHSASVGVTSVGFVVSFLFISALLLRYSLLYKSQVM
jgi:putative oxidoreductase